MNNQISIESEASVRSSISLLCDELNAFYKFKQSIYLQSEYFHIEKAANDSNFTVWLDSVFVLRYRKLTKINRIETRDHTLRYYEDKSTLDIIQKGNSVIINLPLHDEESIIMICKRLMQITYEHYTPEANFGCCSKYIECSNAKQCLHDDKFYAKRCEYRKNLESGRIFYGENKNI